MAHGHVEAPLLSKQEVISITPQFAISHGTWGRAVTNQEIEERFAEGVQANPGFLETTGIVLRHHPLTPIPFLENRGKIGEEMVRVGIEATRAVLAAVGWNGADYLALASSTPADEQGLWGQEIASASGIPTVGYHFLACDGGIDGWLNVLQRKKGFRGCRVVIAAVEPLGYLINPQSFKDSTIFGNGVSAIAFRPDDVELINGKTRIEKDMLGVIRSPKTYDLPSKERQLPIPVWYEPVEGEQDVFAVSEEGVFLKLPEPQAEEDPRYLIMDGGPTARHFARIVPPTVMGVIREGYPRLLGQERIDLCVIHQPSRGVLGLNQRRLEAELRKAGLPRLRIPWVLDQLEMGNCSSATTFAALAQLARLGEIVPGRPFNVTAFGVGSAVTSMNIRLKE